MRRPPAGSPGRSRSATDLPVRFGTPPAPANDLPPADDPPGETYEHCPWAIGGGFGGDDSTDNDRADNAEHDWLHQRRYDYDEIYDPWAPEEREERRQSRLEREQRDGDPFDLDDEQDRDDDDDRADGGNGPEDGEFAPVHDRT